MNAATSGTRQTHTVTRSASVGRWCANVEKKMVPRMATPSAVESCCTASMTPDAEPTSSIVTLVRTNWNS